MIIEKTYIHVMSGTAKGKNMKNEKRRTPVELNIFLSDQ